MTMFLLATSYTAMVIAGLIIEFAFQALDLAPRQRTGVVMEPHVTLNYTTILNILFLALAAILMTRFMKTGGPHMLRMMNKPAPDRHQHAA